MRSSMGCRAGATDTRTNQMTTKGRSRMKPLLILAAAAAALIAANPSALAQQPGGAPGSSAGSGKELEEVIITGTRRTDRTLTESSAPIDVLSGNDLAIEPSGSMMDTLSSLVPSFIVGQNSISDASSFVRSPSLRGLPADEMLVMLDGKRYNRYALVQMFYGGEPALAFGSQGPDLGSIPSIAIKSLEILRDGSSAQYGSDAIAGVLNYQLPEGVPRLPQDVQGSSTTWSHHAAFGDIYPDACMSQPTYTGCPAGGWIKDNNVFNFGGDANGAQLPAFPNAPFYPAGFTPRFYGTTQALFGPVGYKGTTSTRLHDDVSGSSAETSLAASLRS